RSRTTNGTFTETPGRGVRGYNRQHIPTPGPKRTGFCCRNTTPHRKAGGFTLNTQTSGTFGCGRRQKVNQRAPLKPCVPGESGGEHQEQGYSVGSLKRTVRRRFEVIQLACHVPHGEMLVDDATNGCRYRQSRMQAIKCERAANSCGRTNASQSCRRTEDGECEDLLRPRRRASHGPSCWDIHA